MIRYALFDLCNRQPVLSGAKAGRRALSVLLSQPLPDAGPIPCFIDLNGIKVATVSFLRESVLAYRDIVRTKNPNIYPVLANACDAVIEEISFFLAERSDAMWVCRLDAKGRVRGAEIVGKIDPLHRETFDLVCKLGNADAPTLAARDKSIGGTGWNNRLASLTAKGLLIERRAGKTKIFAPVIEEAI